MEPSIGSAGAILSLDWTLIKRVGLAIGAWLGVAKLVRQLRGPKAATTEQRALANDLLDAVLQVQRLVKKRRRGFGDESAIQAALDAESSRADEFFRRARAEWGPRVDELKAAIVACTNQFRYATNQLEAARAGQIPESRLDANWKEHGHVAGLHSNDDSDEFSVKLKTAVDNLEAFLAPILGR